MYSFEELEEAQTSGYLTKRPNHLQSVNNGEVNRAEDAATAVLPTQQLKCTGSGTAHTGLQNGTKGH
jgi:hypothetical protein